MTNPLLIDAMKNPDFYPHHPTAVEFIQTHISNVFIAGDFVYKIKKPLKFDFLDFTSLAKRKFFCEEELRLNKRLAPVTYLDVVAISRNLQGKITLQDGVEIIEYAVRMKKLPAEKMLKTLLTLNLVDEKIMDALAEKIALFHRQAATDEHIDEMGSIENIRHNNEENFSETINYINVTISEYKYRFIKEYVDQFLIVNKDLFEKRILNHKIRDCHGDLHLDHICIHDEITIFDCIEFNERFRCGDVAEDVAFLTMDIDFNGYPQQADIFVKSYINYSGDIDLPAVLNFYRCYYAYVRGKVTSLRLAQEEMTENEYLDIKRTATKYFELAYSYAARLDKPVLILTAGLMGSGKSYQARILAGLLGANIIRTDVIRKEIFALQPSDKRYEDFGKGIYSDDVSRLVYQKIFELAGQKIKEGKSVIIDASFKKREERQSALHLAETLGVQFYILECFCPDGITRQRLERRMLNNDNVSDGRWELFQQQKNDFDVIKEFPENCHLKIDTSVHQEISRRKIIAKIKGDQWRA
ncbi:MAG: AAA family ATPase [Smithella sp.]